MKSFFFVFLLLACSRAPRGGEMVALQDVDPRAWRGTTLTVTVDDTVAVRELNIFLRVDGTFEGARLPLRVHSLAPDGSWTVDKINARVPSGAQNEIVEVAVPWRRGVQFPRRGVYTFTITGAARGVRAIGIYGQG